MVWRINWRAPESHDAIAHVFVNRATITSDLISQATKNAVELRLQLRRLHGFRHLGKTAQVAKHHR